MDRNLPSIIEESRLPSPLRTPQALAWHEGALWLGSRDERRVCGINPLAWSVFEERDVPGIPWAATSSGSDLYFTSGEGERLSSMIEGRFRSIRERCQDF